MVSGYAEDLPLLRAFALIERTQPAVAALLERFFPEPGEAPYPDDAGNVCVGEGQPQIAHVAYRQAVARLGALVAAFRKATAEQAALAETPRLKPGLFHALALMRHPLHRHRQEMLVAKMLPAPPVLHRHDDALASCIWLRLWTLHAWVLELQLAMSLTAETRPLFLCELDKCLGAISQPGASWLSLPLRAGRFMAASPEECLPVRNLAWPNRLGARLPAGKNLLEPARRPGAGISIDRGGAWLNLDGRFAEIPAGGLAEAADKATRRSTLGTRRYETRPQHNNHPF